MLYILENNSLRLSSSNEEKMSIIDAIEKNLDTYRFDHYRYYPTKYPDGWKNLFAESISINIDRLDHIFVFSTYNMIPILLGFRVNEWDEEVFGYKLATSIVTYVPEQIKTTIITQVILKSLTLLEDRNVKSLVLRCNGDQLQLIHSAGNIGFQYYETIIWPVVKTKQLGSTNSNENTIRYIKESEYDKALMIAEQFQYNRGHFYCDEKFDKRSVNKLYAKWISSGKNNGAKVIVIELEGNVAGYFVCKLDPLLKKHLGFEYGRLTSLALDGNYRGKGLGAKLFSGTLNLLKDEGAEFIDSGYATKNHLSAKLHVQNCFMPVYEEVTFHYWFDTNKL